MNQTQIRQCSLAVVLLLFSISGISQQVYWMPGDPINHTLRRFDVGRKSTAVPEFSKTWPAGRSESLQRAQLYAVTQALMEHAYWIFPDMEGMAGGGGGQMGQSESDPETDPPTIKAKAFTFPLLVHEIVKGIYSLYGDQGLPNDPVQRSMVVGAEDTLPAEIWDSRLGPIFWEKLQDTYPDELFEEDTKFIQHYLFVRFSKISAKDFLKLANSILKGDSAGKQAIQRMVNEIIADLTKDDFGWDFQDFVMSYNRLTTPKYIERLEDLENEIKLEYPEYHNIFLRFKVLIDRLYEVKPAADLHQYNFGYDSKGNLKCIDL